MRYVSVKDRLSLHRKNGEVAHQFDQGVLVLGDKKTRNGTDLTTSTLLYTVDAFAYPLSPEIEIFGVKPDFSGLTIDEAGARRIECTGMGSLTGVNSVGGALDSIPRGWWASYFESPIITGNAEGDTGEPIVLTEGNYTVPLEDQGSTYIVLEGTVIYPSPAGTVYTVGQTFTPDVGDGWDIFSNGGGDTIATVLAGNTYTITAPPGWTGLYPDKLIWYEVLEGYAVYNGKVYTKGHIIKSINSVVTIDVYGEIAVSRQILLDYAYQYYKKYFPIRHLCELDDVFEYFKFDNQGSYTAQNGTDPNSFNTFVGNY